MGYEKSQRHIKTEHIFFYLSGIAGSKTSRLLPAVRESGKKQAYTFQPGITERSFWHSPGGCWKYPRRIRQFKHLQAEWEGRISFQQTKQMGDSAKQRISLFDTDERAGGYTEKRILSASGMGCPCLPPEETDRRQSERQGAS